MVKTFRFTDKLDNKVSERVKDDDRYMDELPLEEDNEEDELAIDEQYRPMVTNKRVTMAPVYIYRVLVKESSPKRRFTQAELKEILYKRYEIKIERKAIGRHLHTLKDEGIGIVATRRGSWYDPDKEWLDEAC